MRIFKFSIKKILLLILLLLIQTSNNPIFVGATAQVSHQMRSFGFTPKRLGSSQLNQIYLPVIQSQPYGSPASQTPKINVPYFEDQIRFSETGIFWFGKITPTENYADVRVGYTAKELYIRVGVFDRLLWYHTKPSPDELTSWDAVSLFLNTGGINGSLPSSTGFRFIGQLNWWEPRSTYQTAYRGDGSNWIEVPLSFSTHTAYRGDAPNNEDPDAGWSIIFSVPFNNLGLAGPPSHGDIWGLGLILHDSDDAIGTPIPDTYWPPAMSAHNPGTWGKLSFGLPTYSAPAVTPAGITVIRQGLNGVTVQDGMVGGHSTCGKGLHKWTEWGEANYAGAGQINVQNQFDVADWPCFSKYYLTFPLENIPQDASIISAQLTLYQFGNAGGGEYGEPPVSLIQVFTVAHDWDESTLTWNNAPLAMENVSRSWVDPVFENPDLPGAPRTWDVSMAVAEAHTAKMPLRLALYSADAPYNSGKYFYSSDIGDWNEAGRPTLKVEWANP